MNKTYIVFEEDLEAELPKDVSFVANGIYAIPEGATTPGGARAATDEELSSPDDVIAKCEKDIELASDTFQTQFLGASSAKREGRFSLNLAVAKRVLAGGYEDSQLEAADMQSMELQAAAQNEGRSAAEFCEWIAAWEAKSVLVAGSIEAFSKQSKLGLKDVYALIDPTVQAQHNASLRTQAQAMFANIVNG